MVPQRPFLIGQTGLGAIQRLDLTLLIHTQHHGLLGRIQVQPDHVGHFLEELRIARQLESLHPVRLQLVGLPDIVDCGLTHALTLGHRAATPMRHAFGFGLQGCIHNGGNLIGVVVRFAPASRSNLP